MPPLLLFRLVSIAMPARRTRPPADADAPTEKREVQLADNRRARFDYQIEDRMEAGIALRGTEITHQIVDLLPGCDARGDGTFPRRQQGGRVQIEAQRRIDDPEASVYRNDVKARRMRRPREAIDGAARHAPGPFQHLVNQIPVSAKSIEVRM